MKPCETMGYMGVQWCTALAEDGQQFCKTHRKHGENLHPCMPEEVDLEVRKLLAAERLGKIIKRLEAR